MVCPAVDYTTYSNRAFAGVATADTTPTPGKRFRNRAATAAVPTTAATLGQPSPLNRRTSQSIMQRRLKPNWRACLPLLLDNVLMACAQG